MANPVAHVWRRVWRWLDQVVTQRPPPVPRTNPPPPPISPPSAPRPITKRPRARRRDPDRD